MIVKISSGITNYTGVINYHDKKVAEKKGSVLFSSFYLTERKSVIDYLTEQGEKNTHVKNKGHDIPFSFNKDDVVSDEKAKLIIDDYLKAMGYEHYPHIIYKHDDKEHQHYHLVVSNIDEEGVYNQTMRGLYKKDSQRISRELELTHDLVVTQYTKVDKGEDLTVKHIDDYSFYSKIIKALSTPELSEHIKEIIGDALDYVTEQPQTNDYLEQFLGNKYQSLDNFFTANGVVKKSLKSSLVTLLDNALLEAKDMDSFVQNCEKANLYARYIPSQKEFSFGIENPENNTVMYFKERNLPLRFHAASFLKAEPLKSYPVEHQQKFLKNTINQALKFSKTKESFIEYLAVRNIEVIFNENKAGIQGIGFKTMNIENPTYFKGSDVHRSFSWNNIKNNFNQDESSVALDNKTKEEQNQSHEATIKVESIEQTIDNQLPVDFNDISRIRKYDNDEDEDEHKKRRRNSNKNR